MDKKQYFEEILKENKQDDLNYLDNHDINIESILNEYASNLKDNYTDNKLNFNPNFERKTSYGGYMNDKELEDILKQADDIYSNPELNNLSMDDYKHLLQNDLSKPEELTIYKRKSLDSDNFHYKSNKNKR
jgi:hypothetical protein